MIKKRTAGRPDTHDWSRWDKLLATMPDEQLAAQIGCTGFAVLKRRRKLGIPSYSAIQSMREAGFDVRRKE